MKLISILSLFAVMTISCGRGYFKSDFYLITDRAVEKLRPVDNYYLPETHLVDDPAQRFQIAGAGNLLVASYLRPDPETVDTTMHIVEVRPDLKYRIYTDLPVDLKNDSLDIAGKSLCFLVGQYEVANYLKTYRCGEGFLIIDSVGKDKLYSRLSGLYYNTGGDSLFFRGSITAIRR